MRSPRFSSQELYELRNRIPVDVLIEKNLGIPSKITEGYFRFLCPVCNEFDTSVKADTNLARCFRCEKNYNTIDIVMVVRRLDFVQSVKYLQKIYNQFTSQKSLHKMASRDNNTPQHIAGLIDRLDIRKDGRSETSRKDEAKTHLEINKKIAELEERVEFLTSQIQKLMTSI